MTDVIETVQTLATTLENVQRNMRDEAERHNNYFKRIMEKLDALPSIQTDIAVMKVTIASVSSAQDAHAKHDDLLHAGHSASIRDLEKSKWTVTGAAMAISGVISGIFALFHK